MLHRILNPDPAVRRLRWLMVACMAFSMLNMLVGQPRSFWMNPQTAIRGDGLSVHSPVNRSFDFFLGHGWLAFTASFLAYGAVAFLVVSALPRIVSLVAIFAVVFGHCFVSCTWIGARWHLGMSGVAAFCFLLGMATASAGAPLFGPSHDRLVRRMRWLMAGAILMDMLVTLAGQPGSYWRNPEIVREGNSMSRWFLMHGWGANVAMDLVYCAFALRLVARLPPFMATTCMLGFIFAHFVGVSNWFYFDWRLGVEAPVAYGVLLGSLIVALSRRAAVNPIGIGAGPAAVKPAFCW